jgi:tripartite-type tricarboxylate transporter receptor subunit TctC
VKKRFFVGAVSALAMGLFGAAAAPALAQGAYPTKPVTLIVSFPPGGSSDFFTRTVANELSKKWGQSVVVENRPGAGGNIGAAQAARAVGDGYTLYMSSLNTHGINQALYKDTGFDAVNDFVPISKIATVPNVIVVNPTLPVQNISGLLSMVKSDPAKAFYASSGNGTGPHMCTELLKSMTGTKITHIPYKGSAPALVDVMSNMVPMACDNLPAAMAHIKGGKLRALAVTSATRSPELPDVPTLVEAGVPGYEMTSWWGMFAPRGTPPEITRKINADVVQLLKSAEVKALFAKQGATPAPSTQAELGKLVDSELTRWAKIVKDAGITID